jgi:hypothetical protein
MNTVCSCGNAKFAADDACDGCLTAAMATYNAPEGDLSAVILLSEIFPEYDTASN